MTQTIIHIDIAKLDERLEGGELWDKGWNDWKWEADGHTCLHGAIRYCQPVKGDAYIIEQVSARYGFGVRDNDDADTWDAIKAKVVPDITDDMLAATFGPQWEAIVAMVRRAAVLTVDEAERLGAARGAALVAALDAARDAARGAALDAALNAAHDVARGAAWGAAWLPARGAPRAASALAIRDLIGSHGFTQAHYDTLTALWGTVIGKVHPDDADRFAS